MTELQSSIRSLKEAISVAVSLLIKLEATQKDLEKPPLHIWQHMDIFRNNCGVEMIYIDCFGLPKQVFCLSSCTGHTKEDPNFYLKNAKFLFNIKEKL